MCLICTQVNAGFRNPTVHDLVENVRSAQPGGITGDMEGKSVEGHWRTMLDGPRSLLENGHLGSSDLESYWVSVSEEGGKQIRT